MVAASPHPHPQLHTGLRRWAPGARALGTPWILSGGELLLGSLLGALAVQFLMLISECGCWEKLLWEFHVCSF